MLSPLMESRRSKLLAQIEFAFSATPRPKEREISDPTYDDEGTAEYFRGKTWKSGHTVESLREHSSSLSFFTDEAFRYFLPAYMLATIDDPETADIIPESIEFHLVDSDHGEKRRARLTPAELDAVGAFFCYLSDEWSDRWEPAVSIAYKASNVLGMLTKEEHRILGVMQSLGVDCCRAELRCVQVAEKWRALMG